MVRPIQIGVLGGGQLGYMLAEAALPYNLQFNFLDPDPNCSCKGLAKNLLVGSLYDSNKILELAEISDILTYEIEHVCTETLKQLESQGKKVYPSSAVLEIIQDKQKQKEVLSKAGLPVVEYREIKTSEDIDFVLSRFEEDRFVVKAKTGGYDGKGVKILSREEVEAGKIIPIFESEYFIERLLENPTEISVLLARDIHGNFSVYPSVEMVFDPVANLVDYLFAPANISNELNNQIQEISKQAIIALNGVGIFAVELFIKEGEVFINEIAPRPHNSGHHTIEGNYTSQYQQLVRILLDLPLGSAEEIKPAIMLNIVGSEDFTGEYFVDGLDEVLAIEGVYLHMYGKLISKPYRKLGHITILNNSIEQGIEIMERIKKKLKIKSKES